MVSFAEFKALTSRVTLHKLCAGWLSACPTLLAHGLSFAPRWLDKNKDDGQVVRELLPSYSNATLKSKLS